MNKHKCIAAMQKDPNSENKGTKSSRNPQNICIHPRDLFKEGRATTRSRPHLDNRNPQKKKHRKGYIALIKGSEASISKFHQ